MQRYFFTLLALPLLIPTVLPAAEITVKMAGAAYQPARISAAVGDTIRFVNDDAVNHDVFIPTAAFSTDLGKQEPGQETTLLLAQTGVFDVECVYHSNMLTVVEVK